MSDATFLSQPRSTPGALTTFGGVWRLTVNRVFARQPMLVLLGQLALVGGISWLSARNGSPDEYRKWTVEFYLTFLLPLMCLVSAGGAIRDDLKPACTDYVFTRPVRRGLYLVFRYISQIAVAQASFLLALGIVIGIGVQFGDRGLAPHLGSLLLAQALAICAASAFGFLCALLTNRYVVVGLVYGAVVEVGLGKIPTQLSRVSMSRQVNILLESVVDPSAAVSGSAVFTSVAVLTGFTVVVTLIAAAILQFREFAGARGKEA